MSLRPESDYGMHMGDVMHNASLTLEEGHVLDPLYTVRLTFGGLNYMDTFLKRELRRWRDQTPVDTNGNPIDLHGLITKFANPYMASKIDKKPRVVEISGTDYRHLGILAFGHKSWIGRYEKETLLGYVGDIGKQIERTQEREQKNRGKYPSRGSRFPKFW